MTRTFRNLVERQIQKARLRRQLTGLAGEGKPLPNRPEEAVVDAADAVGFRIMAQAGVLPEEIEIKRLINAHRAHMAGLTDATARKDAMAELARLELRYNIAREARRRFMR